MNNFYSSPNVNNLKNMTPSRTLKINQFLSDNPTIKPKTNSYYELVQGQVGCTPGFRYSQQTDFVNNNNAFVNLEFNNCTPIGSNMNYKMHGNVKIRASSFNYVQ
jgi:hypothetical protein